MSGFTLLWAKILRSSVWVTGTKEVRLLWVAMLALKDSEGRIESSLVGLADAAKLSVEECREALRVLMSPDENDTSGVEEGRRVREIAGGWEIVNHDLYRFSTEAKRLFWAKTKAEYRARKEWPKTVAGVEFTPAEVVAMRVREDAITKRDEETMRRKFGGKSESVTKVEAEYDLDEKE